MKKFLVLLGIGTLITSSLVIPSMSVSPKAEKRLYTHSFSKYNSRRHSDRIGPFNYNRTQRSFRNKTNSTGYWSRFSNRRKATLSFSSLISGRRIPKIYTPDLLTGTRFQTISSKEFLGNPSSSFSVSKDGIYKDKKLPLVFQVVRTPEKYKCKQNFALCAISLNKDFRNRQNISNSYEHKINFQKKQTRALDFRKYPTFMESFKASVFGQENVYFLFSIYDPSDESVIRIEAVASASYEKESAEIMYEIFETFKF